MNQSIWPMRAADAVFTANTLRIMAWPEVERLFAGTAQTLQAQGALCVYGPFRYRGRHICESNAQFDCMLKERDPASGVRDIQQLAALAAQYGMALTADHALPANNRLLEFVKN